MTHPTSNIQPGAPTFPSDNGSSFAEKAEAFFSTISICLFTYPDSSSKLTGQSIATIQPAKGFLRSLGEEFFGIDNSLEKEREEILAIVDQWITEGPEKERDSRARAKQKIEKFIYSRSESSLSIKNLNITTLPDIWGYPTFTERLTGLDLSHNQLPALPESIGQLTALKDLSLFNNQCLTSLPQEILTLPSSCEINLRLCGLSAEVLGRLEEQCNASGYQGPRINFSMENTEARGVDTRTVYC